MLEFDKTREDRICGASLTWLRRQGGGQVEEFSAAAVVTAAVTHLHSKILFYIHFSFISLVCVNRSVELVYQKSSVCIPGARLEFIFEL